MQHKSISARSIPIQIIARIYGKGPALYGAVMSAFGL